MVIKCMDEWDDPCLRAAHLSVCRFCYSLLHSMHILSNKSQTFQRNLALDILERKNDAAQGLPVLCLVEKICSTITSCLCVKRMAVIQ